MNTTQLQDIKWAINSLQSRRDLYTRATNYYNGEHELAFASERFLNAYGYQLRALKANICPSVVDTICDRLQLTGFKVIGEGDNTNAEIAEDRQEALEKKAGEIWRRNRMNQQAGNIHKEALTAGDSYVIVWQDDRGRATIYPQAAGQVVVAYHEEITGFITKASKWWTVVDVNGSKRIRLNIYYPDRIEKYITKSSVVDAIMVYEASAFELIEGDWTIPNPYGKCPVFHFGNNAGIGQLGRGELEDIIPLQDSLNKVLCDMMVASEFNAYPQRYIAGLSAEDLSKDESGKPINPFKSSIESLWLLFGEDAEKINAGTFATGDDSQYTNRINTLREQIAISSGIPLHYLTTVQGGWPSGESLKTSEAKLTAKIKDRHVAFGNVWSDVMRFALHVEGIENVELDTLWLNTEPRNEAQEILNQVLKVRDLKLPAETVWAEMGYTAREIEGFKQKMLEDEAAAQKAFNEGLGAQLGE